MQHDLAQKIHDILIFFLQKDNFSDKFIEFGHASAPQIFLEVTVVSKLIRIIKDSYHMEYLAFDWGLKVEKWTFMIFFRQ